MTFQKQKNAYVTRRRSEATNVAPNISFASRFAERLENSPVIRIWVRFNQSFTILAFIVALIGVGYALNKGNTDQVKNDEDRIAKSWDVIARMAGKQSNGGQVSAIERLNSMKIPLNNVDLHNTYLVGANLEGAKLRNSNFSGATLVGVKFINSELQRANFKNSILIGADLTNANLEETDFTGSQLINARLDLSIVLSKSLSDADLTNSIFVFEDKEGEKWEMYSDTIGESIDDTKVQKLLETACADPKSLPKMNPLLGVSVQYKICKQKLNYAQISRKQPIANGITPFGSSPNPFK